LLVYYYIAHIVHLAIVVDCWHSTHRSKRARYLGLSFVCAKAFVALQRADPVWMPLSQYAMNSLFQRGMLRSISARYQEALSAAMSTLAPVVFNNIAAISVCRLLYDRNGMVHSRHMSVCKFGSGWFDLLARNHFFKDIMPITTSKSYAFCKGKGSRL
jgi:hypothetical protein